VALRLSRRIRYTGDSENRPSPAGRKALRPGAPLACTAQWRSRWVDAQARRHDDQRRAVGRVNGYHMGNTAEKRRPAAGRIHPRAAGRFRAASQGQMPRPGAKMAGAASRGTRSCRQDLSGGRDEDNRRHRRSNPKHGTDVEVLDKSWRRLSTRTARSTAGKRLRGITGMVAAGRWLLMSGRVGRRPKRRGACGPLARTSPGQPPGRRSGDHGHRPIRRAMALKRRMVRR